MLSAAILTILIQYPSMLCGPYTCGAYDTCEKLEQHNVQMSQDAQYACDQILGWDGDGYE